MDAALFDLHYSNMRYSNDTILTDIGRRFRTAAPLPEQDFDYRAEFEACNERHRNVGTTIDKRHFTARFWFNGKQRIVATKEFKQGHEVARFADLCVLRFWKYRQRKPIPTEADFNFTMERAKEDTLFLTRERPEIIGLIDEIENHFLAIGVFTAPTDSSTVEPKEKRTTMGSLMADVMKSSFDEVNRKLGAINADAFEVVKTLDLLSRRFDGMAKLLSELKADREAHGDRLKEIITKLDNATPAKDFYHPVTCVDDSRAPIAIPPDRHEAPVRCLAGSTVAPPKSSLPAASLVEIPATTDNPSVFSVATNNTPMA